jgi:rod shape-determining protein MreC
LTERHARWILIAALVLQLILLSAQAPQPGQEPSRAQRTALWLVAPIAHLVDAAVSGVERMTIGFTVRSSLLRENERLRTELARLKNERIRWFDATGQLERLEDAVAYSVAGVGSVIAADVVYVDHASWLRSLVLYVGDQRAEPNQAVVAPEGAVGRVVSVSGPYAKVQLLTDRSATIGAMIQRTRRQGIARGAEEGMLTLDFVPLRSDVRVGDEVVSAGIDGIYPRGVPVGRVARIDTGDEMFYSIEVTPAVEFGRLDHAFILAEERLPPELLEESPGERR